MIDTIEGCIRYANRNTVTFSIVVIALIQTTKLRGAYEIKSAIRFYSFCLIDFCACWRDLLASPAPRSFKFSTYTAQMSSLLQQKNRAVNRNARGHPLFDITNDGGRIAIVTSKAVVVYDLKTLGDLRFSRE